MKHKIPLSCFLLLFCINHLSISQEKANDTWWNPEHHPSPTLEGQAWAASVASYYDRLPQQAKQKVRKPVWDLSKHTAGLVIRFRSDAHKIKVRYGLNGSFQMPHMPATGVSGVDLYAKNSDGQWHWLRGNRSFADTTRYVFDHIDPSDQYHELGREYQLYLPLYNSVKWLEIGVPEGASFEPLPVRQEKPIVVYGTSIAQGACASRPGMAWTGILSRKMDRQLINLGFSGNGRLEKAIIDLLAEIDAKIYVLDCLPNLTPTKDMTIEEVERRIIASVKKLKEKRPEVPVLLAEHAGYSDGTLNKERHEIYTKLNEVLRKAYWQLKNAGISGLYVLPRSEMALGMDGYVDGTHPSDLGMQHYATAYERSLRAILHEPAGTISTAIPVTQRREPGMYDWEQRHQALLKINKTSPPKVCIFGNSIINYWGGQPGAPLSNGSDSWKTHFEPLKAGNYGFGWDRLENVLWRIYHDALDGFEAEQVVVMLGTNNLGYNPDSEIITGLRYIVNAIKTRQPNAQIHLIGILPRRDQEERVQQVNLLIAELADLTNVNFADVGISLLNHEGKIDESLFTDGLHPNKEGYQKLAPLIASQLKSVD
ncbi:SGNH/GDSL hydrolase family protein [Fulvivirgaceae bacterium BMA12]|uniref:SGNH/GDSL hydrolase family protein n=1 Tax=Agaribacillus aureus TaxID=3051825 RepID=A0ABT8L176_9BACT|nr:SGNH/GDSL hydrolase family protein [Fulvivirgaceae bacterium BMA12]